MTTETETFDALYSKFLAARAATIDPALPEEENVKASERDDAPMREISRTPAHTADRVDIKCSLVYEMM